MKKLRFNYRMVLYFSLTANKHRFSVKCLPVSNEMQNVLDCQMEIEPKVPLSYSSDAFGNRFIYGLIEEPHTQFSVQLSGTAICGMLPGHQIHAQTLMMYRYQSALTKPDVSLMRMHEEALKLFTSQEWLSSSVCSYLVGKDLPLDQTTFTPEEVLMMGDLYTQYVYEKMKYVPGKTGTQTTAEEAATLEEGVCQDYAHVMLSLLRMHGIACRYVVGFVCGEGESHAWVEAAAGDTWYGFDPTNGHRTNDNYLYISYGRDAKDCLMNRGVFVGGGTQRQEVHACLEEVDAEREDARP